MRFPTTKEITYTADEVKAALHAARRTMKFRYDLLDSSNVKKTTLGKVRSGHVENNALAEIKRTARFVIVDDGTIDFLSDRIQPWCQVQMPDGGFAEFPLGVFLLTTPPRKADSAGNIIREVEAYDLLQVLADDKVDDRYTVTAGTNYITAVNTLLTGAGFGAVNLTPTSKTLPTDKEWELGTKKLHIINELLRAINYRSLFIDENGVPVAEPYVSPADRASEYTYKNDSQSVIFPDPVDRLDLFGIPNKFIAVVSQPDRSYLISTYTNANPDSPTSTVSRGRTIVDDVRNIDAADQATLDAYVERIAFEASQVYQQVEFSTGIMPFHSDYDCFTLEYSDLGLSNKYSEVSWGFDLKAGSRMVHRIRKVISI